MDDFLQKFWTTTSLERTTRTHSVVFMLFFVLPGSVETVEG